MLGGAPQGEADEERLIMDVDGAELPFPDNSVDVGRFLLFYTEALLLKVALLISFYVIMVKPYRDKPQCLSDN